MNVLAIGNQKGGTAKTTTTAALAVLLSRRGQRVHVIDMDPQGSLTASFGKSDPEDTLYLALKGRGPLPVVPVAENLTLTPSSLYLATGEVEFTTLIGREYLLKKSIEKTEAIGQGSVVIIDTPPSLGVLSTNSIVAARSLMIVLRPGGFELRALVHLKQVIDVIMEQVNPGLTIAGAVLTICPPRRTLNDQVKQEVEAHYNYLGRVRDDVRMVEATNGGLILDLKVADPGAMHDYDQVLNKLVEVCPWLTSNQEA